VGRRELGIFGVILTLSTGLPARAAISYADIDRHALAVPASSATSVAKLAEALARPARSDEEKARAIFRWMCAHITYDQEAYDSGRHGDTSPEAVLRRRESVCAGYAGLFQALATAAGLRAVSIAGHGKGVGYRLGAPVADTNHDWNAVWIAGRWQLLDVTWGAGAFSGGRWQRRFTEHYFLTPPEEFIFDHFPTDPKWQLLDPPLSSERYRGLAYLRPAFFEHGLAVSGHRALRLAARDSADLTFTGPQDVQLTARLSSEGGGALEDNWTLCQRSGSVHHVLVRWPRAAHYRLTIFAKGIREDGPLWEAADYVIEASAGASSGFPLTYSTFGERGVLLRSPLGATLRAGRPQTFSLIVPDAKEVSVVSGQKWYPLARSGDDFSGAITPSRGPVQVVADSWVLARWDAR